MCTAVANARVELFMCMVQARGMSAVADLGGSILTGIDGNPLAVLVRQLGAPMHEIAFNPVPLYTADGAVADARTDSKVGAHAEECAAEDSPCTLICQVYPRCRYQTRFAHRKHRQSSFELCIWDLLGGL